MRASDRAYRTLLEEIQYGVLAPGTVLAEVEQSTRLGVSRTPLREAIGRLVADGLVVQQSPRVTVVSAVDAREIRQLFEVRHGLEATAARLAADRGDRGVFGDLAAQFESIDPSADADEYYDLIAQFDEELDRAAANSYLTAALRTIRTHLVRVRRLARDKPERLAASSREHHLIAAAIAAANGELAGHATHVHLHNALESILSSLGEEESVHIKGVS